jgi:hypothetical protein
MRTQTFIFVLASPAFLIVLGACTKRMVAGSWERKHFFLGVELTVAAIATVLDHSIDLARVMSGGDDWPREVGRNALKSLAFLGVAIGWLMIVLTIHMGWEKETQRTRMQAIWLIVVTNAIGAGLLSGFALWVKS